MPTTSGPAWSATPASPLSRLRASKSPAPAMIGVAIRKLKRAAASRVRPANRPAEIVIPARLMPGTRAIDWASPKTKASGKVILSSPSTLRPTRSASHRIAAPMTRATATSSAVRTAASRRSLRIGPAITAGIVDTSSSQASLRFGSVPKLRSRRAAIPAGTIASQSERK